MPDRRKIVKVFLASPGDLSDERRAAKAAVDEVNGLFANEFGYHVELVGWEDTVSVFGRPQATINAELQERIDTRQRSQAVAVRSALESIVILLGW
jgi:hypothetical protein